MNYRTDLDIEIGKVMDSRVALLRIDVPYGSVMEWDER